MEASPAMMANSQVASPRATPKRKLREMHDEIPDSISSLSYSLPTRPFSFEVPSPVSMSRSSSYQGDDMRQPPHHSSIPMSTFAATKVIGSSPPVVRFTEKFGNLSIDRTNRDISSLIDNVPSSQPFVDIEHGSKQEIVQVTSDLAHNQTKRLKFSTTPATVEAESILYTALDSDLFPSLRSGSRPQHSKLADKRISKSRPSRKRRSGTPDEPATIVDPIRAALTWQDHEITIYDPNDEDDDGTGVNGIGFKPSPAIAYARLAKRRQQLSDYRKREETEARSRRNERRRGRGGGGGPPSAMGIGEPKSPSRRVRFIEPSSAPVEAK